MNSQKKFSSGLFKDKKWQDALRNVSVNIRKDLGTDPLDLTLFFVSEPFSNFDAQAFCREIAAVLPSKVLIGCNASGVVGSEHEIEMEPAISVLSMRLGEGTRVFPFYFSTEDCANIHDARTLLGRMDIFPNEKPNFICLAEPSTMDITNFLHVFNEAYKGSPMIGGLASAGMLGKPNWLCLNGEVYAEGVVGAALAGETQFEMIVSQGCRPIGHPVVITKADNNMLYELGGREALVVVKEILEGLSAKDRHLAETTLFVGLVMNEKQTSFKRGDFLIRNLMGFNPDTGALMIGAQLRVGQTVQFQVRDLEASEEDLRMMLQKTHENDKVHDSAGILVSCCGRGRNFFGKADHDVKAIQSARGPLSMTGFFANGEIGPIGSKNFIHGYTSSLAIIH